jgi:serine/threonine-protein kinase
MVFKLIVLGIVNNERLEETLMLRELNGYQIGSKLGEGGMASVYQGVQLSLKRPVAIKFLHHELLSDEAIRSRFEQESLIIARLNHPNIIHVIDQGLDSHGQPYFVMEYVKGVTLDAAMKASGLGVQRYLDICLQLCKGLAYAHKNGVVHRDIKPANVIVDYEGNARILDFGIALLHEEREASRASSTASGDIMGTFAYMAPEQMLSAVNATAASDLYALGVVMYQMFTGQLPQGDFAQVKQLNPDIPHELNQLILQCLSQDPKQRPTSADEVKKQLLLLMKGSHISVEQKQRASENVTKAFVLLDIIKENKYGAVYLFEEKSKGQVFIIKKKPRRSGGYDDNVKLAGLSHPNLIKLHGTSKNDQTFILVMEYVTGGSLADRLVQPVDLMNFYIIALQICEGMAFAHACDVVHGNLRPTNVLFTHTGQVKLVDFGLDQHYVESEESHDWYSNENESRSEQADIYSAGVIFYQMLTGELPQRQNYKLLPNAFFRGLPDPLQELLRRMLALDTKKRLKTFSQVAKVLKGLSGSAKTVVNRPAVNQNPIPIMPAKDDAKGNLRLRILLFIALLTVLGVQAFFLFTGQLQHLIYSLLID